jgi:hypothetical protein
MSIPSIADRVAPSGLSPLGWASVPLGTTRLRARDPWRLSGDLRTQQMVREQKRMRNRRRKLAVDRNRPVESLRRGGCQQVGKSNDSATPRRRSLYASFSGWTAMCAIGPPLPRRTARRWSRWVSAVRRLRASRTPRSSDIRSGSRTGLRPYTPCPTCRRRHLVHVGARRGNFTQRRRLCHGSVSPG